MPKSRFRRCAATGESKDPALMVRFVAGPDGAFVPDISGKLPGRGVWVSANRAALEKATARGAISGNLAPFDQIETLLARRCLEYLGLARRAGRLVNGFEKVRAALVEGAAGVLINAGDGSARENGRLARIPGVTRVVELFSKEELSLALGRENVVHAALLHGPFALRMIAEAGRLAGFRSPGSPDGGPGDGATDEPANEAAREKQDAQERFET